MNDKQHHEEQSVGGSKSKTHRHPSRNKKDKIEEFDDIEEFDEPCSRSRVTPTTRRKSHSSTSKNKHSRSTVGEKRKQVQISPRRHGKDVSHREAKRVRISEMTSTVTGGKSTSVKVTEKVQQLEMSKYQHREDGSSNPPPYREYAHLSSQSKQNDKENRYIPRHVRTLNYNNNNSDDDLVAEDNDPNDGVDDLQLDPDPFDVQGEIMETQSQHNNPILSPIKSEEVHSSTPVATRTHHFHQDRAEAIVQVHHLMPLRGDSIIPQETHPQVTTRLPQTKVKQEEIYEHIPFDKSKAFIFEQEQSTHLKKEVKPIVGDQLGQSTSSVIQEPHVRPSRANWITIKIGNYCFNVTIDTITSKKGTLFDFFFNRSEEKNDELYDNMSVCYVTNSLGEPMSMRERLKYLKVELNNISTTDTASRKEKANKQITLLIDRDGTYFETILNYLRTGKLFLPRSVNRSSLLEEAKFFNIVELVHLLEKGDQLLTRCDIVGLLSESPNIIRLRGSNMQGIDLSRMNLSSIDLSLCNLVRSEFTDAMINSCSIKKTALDNTKFIDTDAVEIKMEEIDSRNTQFVRAKMQSSSLILLKAKNWTFEGSTLDNSTIEGCTFEDCIFKGTCIQDANMSSITFIRCDFSDARFDGSSFSKIVFNSCKFFSTSFKKCAFSDMSLDNLNLIEWTSTSNNSLFGCMFNNVTFKRSRLSGMTFSKIEFKHCKFEETKMESITVQQKSKMIHCQFLNAFMKNSRFLQDSEIKFSKFEDTDFRKCQLQKIEFADNQMKKVQMDDTTFHNCSVDLLLCSQCSMYDTRILESRCTLDGNEFLNCRGYSKKTLFGRESSFPQQNRGSLKEQHEEETEKGDVFAISHTATPTSSREFNSGNSSIS